MWLFTRLGFIGLAQHPQEPNKLIVQTQTCEEMEQIVVMLDEIGGQHPIEKTMDGFCRFSTVASKEAAAEMVGQMVTAIDYGRFVQAINFDFGNDPQFLLWMNTSGLQIARVSPE